MQYWLRIGGLSAGQKKSLRPLCDRGFATPCFAISIVSFQRCSNTALVIEAMLRDYWKLAFELDENYLELLWKLETVRGASSSP